MRWSLGVGRAFGIPVRLHFTFLLVVAVIAGAHWMAGGWSALTAGLALVAGLFGSVLLHEFGHALAARRFGIRTHDIELLPIGGVARLERMPERPRHEIVVALAGPAVNVAIAAALFVWLTVTGTFEPLSSLGLATGSIVERVMVANLGLAAFNLLPVFPMDGGRVLRAALATRLSHVRATRIAARAGQAGAVAFAVVGLFGNPFLLLIAYFVWVSAAQEAAVAEWRAAAPARGMGEVFFVRVARRSVPVALVALFGTLAAWAASAAPASAQYFGQNKVRHKAVEFRVLETEHFDIHYYDEKREAAVEVGRMAERWYARLSSRLGHELSSRQAIVLYASHPDFRGTTVVPGEIGETTGGLTDGLKRRIVMPLAGSLAETDHVLGHELVHAFQFDLANGLEKKGVESAGAFALPLWFVEGMAEYLSMGAVEAQTAMWLRDGLARDRLPEIARLDDPRVFPYRWGHAFWAYVAGRFGDAIVGPLYLAAVVSGSPEQAIKSVLKVEASALSGDWHAWIRERHGKPATARSIAPVRALLTESAKGRLNVGPAISPDGRHVAFFSERGRTAIDLYLADAETGKVRKKITELAADPHVDSLQFVTSAGAWTADSQRLAFPSIAGGRPHLSVYDLARDRVERRLALGEIADVYAASWSPDSKTIVLSGIAGGSVDLFELDVATGKVRRLTDDAYAELHPAVSPDGRHIAFVTDRFTSDVAALSFGELRLATLDRGTSAIAMVEAFSTGKHLNPHWSADSGSLTFVADHDGVPNVYRLRLADRRIEALTHLPIGVSGISGSSPALSVASAANRLVFSAFEEGGYQLRVLDAPAASAAAVSTSTTPGTSPRVQERMRTLFAEPAHPVPNATTFRVRDYRARLSADGVAPLQAGVGIGNLGPFVTGGTAITFSDLLGHHNVTLGLQSGSFGGGRRVLDNLSVLGAYVNQANRWTWGITAGQTSLPSTAFGSGFGTVAGQPAALESELTTWELSREISGLLVKPLSRARRIEFSGGYQRLSFKAEERTRATLLLTGETLDEQRRDLPAPGAIDLATTHVALVSDTSVFAGTSPVMGERYRLQVGASGGTVRYASVLADYRRYQPLAGPFSLAARALHVGRYGGDAEEPRLQPLFLGYSHMLRGYDGGSYSWEECGGSPDGRCRAYEQLFGSRMALASVELRTSLSGYKGLLPLPLPMELALFADAGRAWSSSRLDSAAGLSRQWLTSVGATLRVNLFGSAIGALTYVYAPDRPNARWRWQFSMTPGF